MKKYASTTKMSTNVVLLPKH